MSEYFHVEKPFLDQLAVLGWKVTGQGQGIIPSNSTKSLRTNFRGSACYKNGQPPYRAMSNNLNPDKALIFRIVHRDNISWILDHGLHCKNSSVKAPNYRTIGNPDIIQRRDPRPVPVESGGTLSDYVPFHFTPFSPMMYNIVKPRKSS